MDRKLSGATPLSYLGVRPTTPPNLVLVKRAPTITDYKEWCLGDLWLNPSSLLNKIPPKAHDLWMITSMQENIANWVHFGSGDLTYLTADSGGAVGPDDNLNTNIVSGVPNITIVGTPANNTLTIKSDSDHSLLESLTPDTGGAVFGDNSGNINLLGTSGQITTTGTPLNNTVTLSLNDAVPLTFTEDVGIAAAQFNNLNVIGSGGISTSGSGNTVTIDGSGIQPVVPAELSNFLYWLDTEQTNVTGDNTIITVPFNILEWDIDNNYSNTTYKFTASIKGIYYFNGQILYKDSGALTNSYETWVEVKDSLGNLVDSNSQNNNNPYPFRDATTNPPQYTALISVLQYMDVGYTAQIKTWVTGNAAKTASIVAGGVNDSRTWFGGYLVARL